LQKDILEYCLSRKPKGSESPSWETLAEEIYERFDFQVGSISGLRSRVAEHRKARDGSFTYVPGVGVTQVPDAEPWGEGKAPVVEPSTHESFELVVFLSDIHAPYQNAPLVKAAIDLIEDLQPHSVVFNGDDNDFFQLSHFNKGHDREDRLQDELDMSRDIRRAVREAAPNAKLRKTLGNHCDRAITYVEINAKGLSSLRSLKPENLFELDEIECDLYGRAGFRIRPEFVVEHGHVVRKDAGATARSRLNDTLISGIMGHTHRLASFHKTGYRQLAWYEQGCLCLPNPDYVVGEANWQPGIAVGHFHTKKHELFNVELVKATGSGFIFGGRTYGNVEAGVYSEAV